MKEGDGSTSHAFIQPQEAAHDRILESNTKLDESAQDPLEVLTAGESLSTNALKQCVKEKEHLQQRYEKLHEMFLKEKNEHQKTVSALHEKIEEILVRHKDEIKRLQNNHQEQLMRIILSKK